jgi:outer membrane protein OmpA-like peptidoglycan-associated protein
MRCKQIGWKPKFATAFGNVASFQKHRSIRRSKKMKNVGILKGALALAALLCFVHAGSAQADVARRTVAITYPLEDTVNVQFRGTVQFPKMHGTAKVKRTAKTGTKIDLSVSDMPRTYQLGAGYATYVLWAISPEGQVDRLGEIKRRGFFEFSTKVSVTTPLQTFALLVTAEPHFLVTRPSQKIMLENISATTETGANMSTSTAVHYFGNSSDYFRDPKTPEIAEQDYAKTPSAILQGYQALALARYSGAERDAPDELQQAADLLKNAEASWQAGRDEDTIDILARQAISTAVKAEATSVERREARERRNERTRSDAEMRRVEDKLADALRQIAELKDQLNSETRNRELSERDVANYNQQIKDLRTENGRLREELGRTKVEFDNVKTRLEVYDNEKRTAEEQRDRDAKIAAIAANEPAFIQALRKFGTVSRSERGIILTLPEAYWSAPRAAEFAPTADPKMTSLSEVLANNPEYQITIESHTDDRGAAEELQDLTQKRSRAVADKLSAFGIDGSRVESKGMGASLPIAPNTTTVNRARNRRVQIIMSPILRKVG